MVNFGFSKGGVPVRELDIACVLGNGQTEDVLLSLIQLSSARKAFNALLVV